MCLIVYYQNQYHSFNYNSRNVNIILYIFRFLTIVFNVNAIINSLIEQIEIFQLLLIQKQKWASYKIIITWFFIKVIINKITNINLLVIIKIIKYNKFLLILVLVKKQFF